mgnify:CR=1 FL=1
MANKCVYCKTSLDENSVIDVCRRCGLQVWGENMFNAIVQNMEDAREAGDLFQGSVTQNSQQKSKSQQKQKSSSFVSEAITTLQSSKNEESMHDVPPIVPQSEDDYSVSAPFDTQEDF